MAGAILVVRNVDEFVDLCAARVGKKLRLFSPISPPLTSAAQLRANPLEDCDLLASKAHVPGVRADVDDASWLLGEGRHRERRSNEGRASFAVRAINQKGNANNGQLNL